MTTKSYSSDAILVYPVIESVAPIHTSVMLLRNYLRANLTDPLASSRSGHYVYTNYPSDTAAYPHVIVYQHGGIGDRVGGNSWMFDANLAYTMDTLAKKVEVLDVITDDLISTLIQGGFEALHGMGFQRPRIMSFGRWNPMPGVPGVYRKTTEITFHMHLA